MNKHSFQVRPLQQYDGARYPSAYARPVADAAPAPAPADEEEERLTLGAVLRYATMLVLVVGLSVGLVACFTPDWSKHIPGVQSADAGMGGGDGGSGDDGGDITMGVMAECTPGEVMCSDDYTLATCSDGHSYDYVDCNDWCMDEYGPEWGLAYSLGCDASAAEPCQCEYDMIAGVMAECTPGEVMCADDETLMVCSEYYYYDYFTCADLCRETLGNEAAVSRGCDAGAEDPCQCELDVMSLCANASLGQAFCLDSATILYCTSGVPPAARSCDEVCRDQHGEEAWSAGCNLDADDPCQCQYDILAGVPLECTPGDIACADDQTLMVCSDEYLYDYLDCDARCQETLQDPFAYSLGCDTAAEDPCQCEYGMIDGDIAECTPGDVYCLDQATAQVCNSDAWSWTTYDCPSYCSDTFGPGFGSIGCDAQDPDNFCGCKEETEG